MSSFAALRTTGKPFTPFRTTRRSLLVASLLPPPAFAQNIWYAVRAADRSFIVDMPGDPIYKVIDATSRSGSRYVVHSYSLEAAGLSFVAQTAVPPDVDVGDSRRALQAIVDLDLDELAAVVPPRGYGRD